MKEKVLHTFQQYGMIADGTLPPNSDEDYRVEIIKHFNGDTTIRAFNGITKDGGYNCTEINILDVIDFLKTQTGNSLDVIDDYDYVKGHGLD